MKYASTVHDNLVITLKEELLYVYCSVSHIISEGKLHGCGEIELRNNPWNHAYK